jgi:hypothetical protein
MEPREQLRSKVMTMAVHGVPHLPSLPGSGTETHTTTARWAVGLAELAVGILVVGAAVLGLGLLVGGADAIEDTTLGALGVAAVYVGITSAVLGFLTAVTVRIRQEAWTWLWLPLVVFPTVLVLILLGELFVWE